MYRSPGAREEGRDWFRGNRARHQLVPSSERTYTLGNIDSKSFDIDVPLAYGLCGVPDLSLKFKVAPHPDKEQGP